MSAVFDNVIDVRAQLYRNTDGGPNRSVPLASKRGLIVHWNGPTVGADDRRTLMADSAYHALQKDWSPETGIQHGDGLMYHIAIGQDGALYWCRDLGAVLWHCGAWSENEIALSVLVLCAASREPTEWQLASLRAVCDRWLVTDHGPRSAIKGHVEVSATDCPGPVLLPWVRAYRKEPGVPVDEDDIRLEAMYQREKAMLGLKRHKAWFTRPYYTGNVLWADRGLVAPTVALTDIVRQGLTDDTITIFEGNGWTGAIQ